MNCENDKVCVDFGGTGSGSETSPQLFLSVEKMKKKVLKQWLWRCDARHYDSQQIDNNDNGIRQNDSQHRGN
jgi:hypothetical protein